MTEEFMFDYKEASPEKRTRYLFGPGYFILHGAALVSVHLTVM